VVRVPTLAGIFEGYIRRLDVFGGDGADVPTLRARLEHAAPKVPFWYGIRTSLARVGGVSGEWVETTRSASDRVLLYLHGGGWFMGSPRTHRSLVAELVRASAVRAFTLDYRLAPEHPYPAALDDCLRAFEGLLASGIAPGKIVLVGDSAGGNLALALLLRLRDAGRPLPRATVLLSPVTDLTMSGDSHTSRKLLDPYVAGGSLRPIIERYVPAGAELGPYQSPLQADLRGLPPMLVHVGDHEVLLDDAIRLGGRAAAADVECRVVVWPGMMHVFHSTAPFLPDARRAIREVAEFIRERFVAS
jgi:monoterpene epsilon-lactone hydrolase